MPPPIDVRRWVYDELERKVMNPFKNDYMNCSTPAERKAFATSKIFPKLFNHWAKTIVLMIVKLVLSSKGV